MRHAVVGNHGKGTSTLTFRNRLAFWIGTLLSSIGVLLHLPMYISAAPMGYRMAGMTPDWKMTAGMVLILIGLGLAAYGLTPRMRKRKPLKVRVDAETKMNPAMIQLLIVLAVAIVIDAMKPITLAFVAPGVAAEYGLTSPNNPDGGLPVALLPLAGITGTVIGSFVWAWFGDRAGRRASIVLAGLVFMTTSICGTMPSFTWNLFMCFLMGLGAGGMLPVAFTMIAETVPTRHRGWLIVALGGEITGTYAIVSWLSSELVPVYSWRVLWLLGLPTGLLLILLSQWVPESPRFLYAQGKIDEAHAVLRRFGAILITPEQAEPTGAGRFTQLGKRPLLGLSTAITLLGIGVGFVTFGFSLWIPSNLQHLGFAEGVADAVLRDAALIGYPFTFVVALLYGFWSSKRTILLLSVVTVVALVVFVSLGDAVADDRTILAFLLAVPILGSGAVVAVLGAYASEVYPTVIRARGGGLAAGAAKLGGVLVIGLTVAAIPAPSIRTTALLGAIPMTIAVGAVLAFGVETSKRRLGEINAGLVTAAAGSAEVER